MTQNHLNRFPYESVHGYYPRPLEIKSTIHNLGSENHRCDRLAVNPESGIGGSGPRALVWKPFDEE